jgi:hypothetical protein
MATGLEQSPPVDPVGPSIAIIVQVISPITNGQVARINAAAIMAKMADDLISVGGKPVQNAKNKPISTILASQKPHLSRLLSISDHAPVFVLFGISQQLIHLCQGSFLMFVQKKLIPNLRTIPNPNVMGRNHMISTSSSTGLSGSS